MTEKDNLIKIDNIGNVVIVGFSEPNIGAMDGIETVSGLLRDYVDKNQPEKLVIDFANVKFFSSQALGMLIEIWRKLEKYQGKMVISGINPQLYRVFKITNLDKIFVFYKDASEAVESFK